MKYKSSVIDFDKFYTSAVFALNVVYQRMWCEIWQTHSKLRIRVDNDRIRIRIQVFRPGFNQHTRYRIRQAHGSTIKYLFREFYFTFLSCDISTANYLFQTKKENYLFKFIHEAKLRLISFKAKTHHNILTHGIHNQVYDNDIVLFQRTLKPMVLDPVYA